MLAADTVPGVTTLQNVLGAHVELVLAHTISEATALLTPELDAIVCGIHFDESRMFDLLRLAKAHPAIRRIPFVCYRDLDTDLGATVVEGLDIATKALGAAAFVDTYSLKRMNGVANADADFRDRVMVYARQARTSGDM
ncbi:hypothetical protein [Lysobacter sp. D1-1-M9]|uniref:hypothetical protein n=1 Tax=Novilysobacter longmucuonensis TaxID=3098603 RepID=UPI002FC61121